MNTTSLVIALFVSIGLVGYIYVQNRKEEEKKDNVQLIAVFGISSVIVYMISNLVMDNDDDKLVMSNIKMGEPPF